MSGFSTTRVVAPVLTRPTKPMPITATARALDSVGSTDILNVLVSGKLIGVTIRVSANPVGSPSAKLKINIDGQGFQDVLSLYSASSTWTEQAQDFSLVGDGNSSGDRLQVLLNVDFDTSCVVALECTAGGTSGTLSGAPLYAQEI